MFEVGSFTFNNKTEAKAFMRELVERTLDDTPITGRDHRFLDALARRHPSATQKIGAGVRHFTIRQDPYWKRSRQLILHRIDGSSTDISWVACFDGKYEKSDILGAMRDAVAEQVLAVKREAFLKGEVICPYTGVPISPETAHVDHEPPQDFAALVESWLAAERLSLQAIAITDLRDHQSGREMVDPQQKTSWMAFHRRHATLRVVSAEVNLTLRRFVQTELGPAHQIRRQQIAAEGFRWSPAQGRWMRGDQWQISDEAIDRMSDEDWLKWLTAVERPCGWRGDRSA